MPDSTNILHAGSANKTFWFSDHLQRVPETLVCGTRENHIVCRRQKPRSKLEQLLMIYGPAVIADISGGAANSPVELKAVVQSRPPNLDRYNPAAAPYSPSASARDLPDTCIASVAAMNASRSPSKTPDVSLVSCRVRRSFTIW